MRTLACAPLLALALLLPPAPAAAQEKGRLPTLFIVGDSTVKNNTRGQQGWGDPLAGYFDPAKIRVENHAIGGRSSRSFRTEGRWEAVLNQARPGDFVLIQFGHNDPVRPDDPKRPRGTLRGTGEETREIDHPHTGKKETVHTYGWYLRAYITEARAKGMTPIILSPIPRRPREPVEKGAGESTGYPAWAREVATAARAPFVDLHRLVLTHYATLTPAEIKERYFTPADDTHTSPAGAERNAACVVEGLRALPDCRLKDFLRPAKE
jgi:lysophospholipase L1-like esterase